ncbi:YggT family protein [Streptococcus sanguinis]|uniref:YggT family protein n=1 Tax=Streptococcus sanguinis TaxID=1305 RepID=A0A7H8V299_STRSA|nr:YggT family protein [Streptococcus sanguinis]QLB50574.1 YggT family protein [Streptococcus sanguinis]QLB52705.1 YggT family protein [Streptococcus sanguinis]
MLYFVIRAISNLVDLYSIALIVYALLSWFPGAYQTKFGEFLTRIVEPYLKLFRRLPLQFAGLDFTVWVAILALNLLNRVVFYLISILLMLL